MTRQTDTINALAVTDAERLRRCRALIIYSLTLLEAVLTETSGGALDDELIALRYHLLCALDVSFTHN